MFHISVRACTHAFHISHAHVLRIIRFINFQMTTWSFRDMLAELKVRGHFDESVLQRMQGLCMGDICFAEIQTTFKMCTWCPSAYFYNSSKREVSMQTICLQTVTVVPRLYFLLLSSDPCLEDIEHVGIGNIIWRRGSPLGDITSIHAVIDDICKILAVRMQEGSTKAQGLHNAYRKL